MHRVLTGLPACYHATALTLGCPSGPARNWTMLSRISFLPIVRTLWKYHVIVVPTNARVSAWRFGTPSNASTSQWSIPTSGMAKDERSRAVGLSASFEAGNQRARP